MQILLLAGDGIGPEIMAEAEKVVAALAPLAQDFRPPAILTGDGRYQPKNSH